VNSRSKETRTRQDGPLEIIEVGEWGRAFSAGEVEGLDGW
jgi:hypothetical protein